MGGFVHGPGGYQARSGSIASGVRNQKPRRRRSVTFLEAVLSRQTHRVIEHSGGLVGLLDVLPIVEEAQETDVLVDVEMGGEPEAVRVPIFFRSVSNVSGISS